MGRSGGLVSSFLDAFQGLQQMELQKRRDEEVAAQNAVDNELRRFAMKQKSEAQAQMDAYREDALRLREERYGQLKLRDDEMAAMREANFGLKRENQDLAGRREERVAAENRRRLVGPGLARGETEREARMNAGYLPNEADAELQGIANARMPGAQAAQGQAVGQNMAQVVAPAIAQAMAGLMGAPGAGPAIGGAVPVPGLPSAESIGREQSKTFIEGSKLRESQLRLRDAQQEKVATQTTQLIQLGDLVKQQKEAQVEREKSQNLVNSARYKEILSGIQLNREKFDFDKIIRNGKLDLDKINTELRRIESDRAANRDIRASHSEAKAVEQLTRQYKADQQKIYMSAKNELWKAEKARQGAVEMKAQIASPTIMNSGIDVTKDPHMREMLLKAEQTLAEYTPDKIKQLRENVTLAERSRNEADNSLKKAQSLYSVPMTSQGTVDKKAYLTPGKQIMATNPASIRPIKISNEREWQNIPRGTVYIDPTGKRRTKQ